MHHIKMVVKSAGKDQQDIVFGEDDKDTTIGYLKIFLDTLDDDAKAKSNNMLARIEVSGSFEESAGAEQMSKLKYLFDWAKEKSQASNYRKVLIEIFDSSDKISRSYEFPDMFVLDYIEEFATEEKDDKSKGTKFSLKLNQKQNMIDKNETKLGGFDS